MTQPASHDAKADRKRRPYASSVLAKVGADAAHRAQRALLLRTLIANNWHLSNAADALQIGPASNVIRAIQKLGLMDQYNAARAEGVIRQGQYGRGRPGKTLRLAAPDRSSA
jgi:hypothetical protein